MPSQRNAQSELEENNVEQERLKGSPVAYGISVQVCSMKVELVALAI